MEQNWEPRNKPRDIWTFKKKRKKEREGEREKKERKKERKKETRPLSHTIHNNKLKMD